MPPLSSKLQIAVLGAGKIGSTFASRLARFGGHDVTVIARPGSMRLQQLERDNAIIDVTGERSTVRVASMLDEQTPFDLVIVTLLAHQSKALLPALRRSEAKCVQFMFNTFNPERLQDAIGAERCSFGMPFVQATLDGDGRLKATIGAGGQKTIMSRQRWVDVFNAAGLARRRRSGHAALAAVPRSAVHSVRKRISSWSAAGRRRFVGRSDYPGTRLTREFHADQGTWIPRLSNSEKAH